MADHAKGPQALHPGASGGMTFHVHQCPCNSMAYASVGIPTPGNQRRIIVLRFPECPPLDTRDHPCPTLTKEYVPR